MSLFAAWLISLSGWGHLAAADGGGAEPVRIRIVLGARAQSAETEGAKELCDYMAKATGTTLSISKETDEATGPAIVLGTPQSCDRVAQAASKLTDDWKGLGLEGFIMKNMDGNIYIAANTGIGVRHGCYDFLESFLGIRWLKPVDGDYVPKSGPFATLPNVNKCSVPGVVQRHVTCDSAPMTALWLKRQRMSCLKSAGGHFYYAAVPPSLFEQHPEYFSLVNGKRVKENGQLCTSNPEVQKLLVAWAVKQAEAGVNVLNLGANDTGGWCECESCLALDPPEERRVGLPCTRYLKSLELLADTMAQKFPEVILNAYGYGASFYPPKGGYRPPANLGLIMYGYGWCYLHGCDDRSCPCTQQMRGLMEQWRQKTGMRIGFGAYLHEAHGLLMPPRSQMFPIASNIASEIRLERDLGGIHWHAEAMAEDARESSPFRINASDDWWGNKLTYYVAAKLTWNPDLDENALGEEFYRCFFGPAGEPLWQAYQLMAKSLRALDGHSMYFFPSPWAQARFMTPQLQDQLAQLHQKALALVPSGDSKLLARIQREIGFVEKWKQLAKQTPPQSATARRITSQSSEAELLEDNSVWDKVEQMPLGYTRKSWGVVSATNAGPCYAQMAWDAQNVYLRITTAYDDKSRLPETNTPLLKTDDLGRVTGDCKLEMYVNPDGKRDSYYDINHGSDNILYASYSPMGFIFKPADMSTWRVCQSFDGEKRVWRVLFIFPASAFNRKNFASGQKWAISVKFFNKGIVTGWPDSSLHDSNAWGIITLVE